MTDMTVAEARAARTALYEFSKTIPNEGPLNNIQIERDIIAVAAMDYGDLLLEEAEAKNG